MLPPEVKTSTIIPTPVPPSFTVKRNNSTDKSIASDPLNITLAQVMNLTFDNTSVTMAGKMLLQHTSLNGWRGLNTHQSSINDHSSLFKIPVTPPLWASGKDIRIPNRSDHILEPSLQPQVWENPLQHLIFQLNASSPKASHRTDYLPNMPISQLCSTCGKEMPAFSLSANVAVTHFETTPSSLLLGASASPPTGKSLQLHRKNHDFEMFNRLPPNDELEGQPVTKKISANFLQQSELDDAAEDSADDTGHTPPWMTKPVREVVVPGKGSENPSRGMHLAAAQLGILLGCSAVLGMALAAGLRCIHAQYCHKRTEVSFSEPDANVITLRETGEMMEFRKVRENSFVLVQAEYNWITPSNNGKK